MKLETLKSILNGICGYADKVAYHSFPVGEAPELPFIVYLETGNRPMFADNKNYFSAREITVELYTQYKDEAEEAKVEAALSNAEICWEKDEEYLDDEKCWVITYTTEV